MTLFFHLLLSSSAIASLRLSGSLVRTGQPQRPFGASFRRRSHLPACPTPIPSAIHWCSWGRVFARPLSNTKPTARNLGHERVLTTLSSYGRVPEARQAELIQKLGKQPQELPLDGDAVLHIMRLLHSANSREAAPRRSLLKSALKIVGSNPNPATSLFLRESRVRGPKKRVGGPIPGPILSPRNRD